MSYCGKKTKKGKACKRTTACPFHSSQSGGNFGPFCAKINQRDKVDLNTITATPTLNGFDWYINGDLVTVKQKLIGEGTYGKVFLMTVDGTGKEFVMKQSQQKMEQVMLSQQGLKERYEQSCKKYVADYKVIDEHHIIMNAAVMDLNQLKGKLTIQEVKSIVNQVHDALLCLQKSGIYYLESKPANILLMCHRDGSEIVLGDIGSMYPVPLRTPNQFGYISSIGFPVVHKETGTSALIPADFVKSHYKKIYRFHMAVLAMNLFIKAPDPLVFDEKDLQDVLELYGLDYVLFDHFIKTKRLNVNDLIQIYVEYFDKRVNEGFELKDQEEEHVKEWINELMTYTRPPKKIMSYIGNRQTITV